MRAKIQQLGNAAQTGAHYTESLGRSKCVTRLTEGPAMEFVKQIETLFRTGTAGGLTDGQLLELFLERRGEDAEAAFASLVDRHGAMVLRICRQILGAHEDAEDAAQATFLVLAKRAGTISRRESLGCWLHGVALRVAANYESQPHAGTSASVEGEKCEPSGIQSKRISRRSTTTKIGQPSTTNSVHCPKPSASRSFCAISMGSPTSRRRLNFAVRLEPFRAGWHADGRS